MRGSHIGAIAAARQNSVNFASLLVSPMQSMQTDRGLTFGATPKAKTGNTSTTVLSLSGSNPSTPVPIKAKATNSLAIGSGGAFNIYYDGGTTPAMTGVVPVAATPVALTGAALGQSLSWSAGSVAINNEWDATCSAWADQSGNGNNYAQASASLQPIVTVGLSGKPGLLFDGIDDYMDCATLNLPAPVTTPYALFAICRTVTWLSQSRMLSSVANDSGLLWQYSASPNVAIFNGNSIGASTGPAIGTFAVFDALFISSASCYLKAGSGAPLGFTTPGNLTGTGGRRIGNGQALSTPSNIEVLALGYMPQQAPSAITALRAAASAFYGGSLEY